MSRYRLAAAVIAGFVATVVPVAASAYLAWRAAISEELDRLHHIAAEAVLRNDRISQSAGQALRGLAAETFAQCSPAHIDRIRHILFQSPFIRDIAVITDGEVRCSSQGMPPAPMPLAKPDWDGGNGIMIWFSVPLHNFPDIRFVMVAYRGSAAVIDSRLLTDVVKGDAVALDIVHSASGGSLTPGGNGLAALFPEVQNGGGKLEQRDRLIAGVASDRYPLYALAAEGLGKAREAWLNRLPAFGLLGLATGLSCASLVAVRFRRRSSLRGELEEAIRDHELQDLYQPIVSLTTGQCAGAEALVRWQRPDGLSIRPDVFIPLAEDAGLIEPITDQMIEMVAGHMGETLRRDAGLYVSINLSARDLHSDRIIGVLDSILAKHGVSPRQIVLEATERSLIDAQAAAGVIERLHHRGFRIAIDDFGTGYSGLSIVQNLKLDSLKIDKSFIDALEGGYDGSVIPDIAAMARKFGLRIVAEGISTVGQADYLRRQGVDYGQGWLYGKPMTVQEFAAFAASRNRVQARSGE